MVPPMSDPGDINKSSLDAADRRTGEAGATESQGTRSSPAEGASETLSAEEQMAAYEKDLKENDWGHQPC